MKAKINRLLINKELKSNAYFILILLVFPFYSSSVFAFEDYEHRELSNRAFKIAVKYVNHVNKLEEPKKIDDNIFDFEGEDGNDCAESSYDKISYGDITKIVDYMHYPRQIFEYSNKKKKYNGYPQSKCDLNKNALNLKKLTLFYASTRNQRHFQAALLESMNTLHKQAMVEAAGGEVFSALVTNALSDHFLHDFFAPGHIVTGRENSHDAIALAQHDEENKKGACFAINDNNREELNHILDYIKNEELIKELELLIRHDKEIDADIASIIDKNSGCYNDENEEILRNNDQFKVEELKRLGNLLQNNDQSKAEELIIDTLLNKHYKYVHLQGDDYLFQNPIQQVLIILIQIRSITDVLNMAICKSRNCQPSQQDELKPWDFSKSTTEYSWIGTYTQTHIKKGGKVDSKIMFRSPFAEIRHGLYIFEPEWKKESLSNRIDKADQQEEPKPAHYEEIKQSDRRDYRHPIDLSNLFLISVGGQAPFSQKEPRLVMNFEFMPTSLFFESLKTLAIQRPSSDCSWKSLCNTGLAIGADILYNNNFSAYGGHVRFIKALPLGNTHVSFYVKGMGFNDRKGNIGWRVVPGARIDLELSLISVYLGLEPSYRFTSRNQLTQEWVMTFGISAALPFSRIKRETSELIENLRKLPLWNTNTKNLGIK